MSLLAKDFAAATRIEIPVDGPARYLASRFPDDVSAQPAPVNNGPALGTPGL